MVTTLFFVGAFGIVALLVYMARYSGRLRIEETRLIAAPIAAVYAKVADFREWAEWNPWQEHEPQAAVTLIGPPDDRGGCYVFDGPRMGSGEIRHVAMAAPERIEQRLDFVYPFRFRGRGQWHFAERDGRTEVTWTMRGRVAFSLRAFAPTVQGSISLDYRYALAKLARLVEPSNGEAAAKHYMIEYLGLRNIEPCRYAYRTYEGPLDKRVEALSAGFAGLREALAGAGEQASGMPIAAYVKTNTKWRTTVCHLGIPVAAEFDRLPVRELPGHRAFVARLTGTYSALEVAWYEAMQHLRAEGLQPNQRIAPFERYLNDATATPERELITELHIPVSSST